MVREQIEVLLQKFPDRRDQDWSALLGGDRLRCRADHSRLAKKKLRDPSHFVVDPVMIATSGDNLLEPEAVEAYKNKLFPLATLITPNLDEAALLLETTIKDRQTNGECCKSSREEISRLDPVERRPSSR